MSIAGASTATVKSENSQFKKDTRNSSGNVSNIKEEKRSSDNFSSNQNRGPGLQGNRHSDSNNRSRSGNRNDNRHYDKQTHEPEIHDKDDKGSSDPSTGPTGEKKFSGRCRLFVGNITPDVTEDEFRKMFEAFGEVSEMYVNSSRGFGFIRLDYRHNAEAAKAALDGQQRKGRVLRIRFATHGAALRIKNLHPYVSNELLEQSFSQFGDLERCVVIVDDRGKSTGEGIVEFVRKPAANSALRRITEGVFLMGSEPKPILVEPLEHKDEEDGLPEKLLTKTEQYKKEREKEPRFAPPGTFEYEFGMRWKQLEELEKQRIEQAKKDTDEARLKLEDEMQNALYDYQADQIRQELLRQQEELRRLEELRNQDRMRRQKEYDIRHQQEERERAQQEERRRADTMMMLRQQELARGRGGPMDMPGLKGREELMMGDRFGDRMPENYPDRMGDRMPDRMGGDRLPDRMGGDRLPDRMGGPDRMVDRMGDRMGPGQPGFMWDDKQRGDAGMRGDAGRGRGPGAPPLQPPPVPPTSVNPMERGGPNPVAGGGPQQSGKVSPKPLMQSFSNIGNVPGGGPGPNAPGVSDPNAMDDDSADGSQFYDAEDTDVATTKVTAGNNRTHETCLATAESPDISNELFEDCKWQCSPNLASHLEAEGFDSNCRMYDAHQKTKASNGIEVASNLTFSLSLKAELTPKAPDKTIDNHDMSGPSDFNHYSELDDHPHNNGLHLEGEISQSASEYQLSDKSADKILSDSEYKMSNPVTGNDVDSVLRCPENDSQVLDAVLDLGSCKEMKGQNRSNMMDEFDTFTNHTIINNRQSYSPMGNFLTQSSYTDANTELHELPVYTENIAVQDGLFPLQDVSGETEGHCPMAIHSEDSSSQTTWHKPSPENLVADLPNQHLQTLYLADLPEVDHITDLCSKDVVNGADTANNFSTCSQEKDAIFSSLTITRNLSKQSHTEHKLFPQEEHYNQSVEDKHLQFEESNCEQKTSSSESCYKEIHENSNQFLNHTYTLGKESSSSSRHNTSTETEEMDTETVGNDIAQLTVNSKVYQNYGEDIAAIDQSASISDQTTMSEIALPVASEMQTIDGTSNSEALPNSQTANSETSSTSIPTVHTVTEAATSSTEEDQQEQVTLSTSSSPSSQQSLGPNGGDHERVFNQSDQPFISATARNSVPFLPAGCSLPYVPGMNPSMYAGPAMVQGMVRPTVLTSSSVHIAQHPGGATIMQHQSMSTNGGMTQATVMQQQAMPNGLQATSVLQRTMTNGGQTMVVQQRTMTTGLDGRTQQTVLQQQVAGPTIAQAAFMHANAMRQRTMASQQASMMQQRAIRLVQTGVMGGPVLHAQTLGGATLIPRGTIAPTALVGHGLLRGISQGTMMQQLVRQRYLGGPVMPGRGIQLVAGRPIRVKMTYPRESMPMDT